MIVRAAHPDDAAAIADLVNHVIRETTVTFTTLDKSADDMSAAIQNADGAYFVAERHGTVVGYATYFPFRAGPGYARTQEHSIVLARDAWGQGAGRALMAELEAHARAAGVHVLMAGVSAENDAGIAFHRALGFAETGRLPEVGHKFGRWIDLVLMQKFL
ncbi:N-acetyltransferase family protein [Roseobacteraceae bacterium S113]